MVQGQHLGQFTYSYEDFQPGGQFYDEEDLKYVPKEDPETKTKVLLDRLGVDLRKLGEEMKRVRKMNMEIFNGNWEMEEKIGGIRREVQENTGLLYHAKKFAVGSWEFTCRKFDELDQFLDLVIYEDTPWRSIAWFLLGFWYVAFSIHTYRSLYFVFR
uniref:t-SNARE coiled-coil homology domain-containing protein n=1 Tax=Caenorhabditis tropicalis TaxID=1561998 RepID=A0A1I7U5B2_9PELO